MPVVEAGTIRAPVLVEARRSNFPDLVSDAGGGETGVNPCFHHRPSRSGAERTAAVERDDDLYKKPTKPAFNLIEPSVKGGRRYNETRDIAYFFPHMMRAVIDGLANYESDPPMLAYMQKTGVTPDDLLAVIHKFCDFIREVVNGHAKFSSGAFETACKVGLEQTNPHARYLLMGRIGIATVAMFHDGFMDAFVSGLRPTLTELDVKDLIDRAFKAFKEKDRIVINTTEASA